MLKAKLTKLQIWIPETDVYEHEANVQPLWSQTSVHFNPISSFWRINWCLRNIQRCFFTWLPTYCVHKWENIMVLFIFLSVSSYNWGTLRWNTPRLEFKWFANTTQTNRKKMIAPWQRTCFSRHYKVIDLSGLQPPKTLKLTSYQLKKKEKRYRAFF